MSIDAEDLPDSITIRKVDYSFCIGDIKNGKQCNNRPCKGSNFCRKHKHYHRFTKPGECPICLEHIKEEYKPLSCGHWCHRKCLIKWDDKCPICKARVTLSKKNQQLLIKNKSEQTSPPDREIIISLSDDLSLAVSGIEDLQVILSLLLSSSVTPESIENMRIILGDFFTIEEL